MLFFNNTVFYRFTPDTDFTPEALEQALDGKPFTPCSRHELKRSGWVSPTEGLTDGRVFATNGFLLICLQREERILPASVVRDALAEKVEQIEQAESRKVYRKERATLKDEVTFELLPRAFTRRRPLWALISPVDGWIIINTGTASNAETLLSELREALGSLRVRLPEVQMSPGQRMAQWILDESELPTAFQLEQEALLQHQVADDRGTVRVKDEPLTSDEVRAHIEGGMTVRRLALCWEHQIRFVLHDDLTLHRVRVTDEYREQLEEQSPEEELAALDADVTQLGLEYRRLIPQLFAAFGGELAR